MSYCDNLDVAAAQLVDQAEGKPGKDVTAGAGAIAGPSVRSLGHRLNGMPELLPKTTCRR
jgi:hypothetical protein